MPDQPRPDPNRTASHVPPTRPGPAEPSSLTNTDDILGQLTPSFPGPRSAKTALPAVPGYAVVAELARGGMGVVYQAHDLALDREVAIKVLLPGLPPEEAARRFVRESKITAKLPHP